MEARITPSRILMFFLLLGALSPSPLLAEKLALLVGSDAKGFQRAARSIESMEGVEVVTFELFKGVVALDDAKDKLSRFPFDAALALGESAEVFLQAQSLDIPTGAALVHHGSLPVLEPFEAPAEKWTDLFRRLLPDCKVVTSVAERGPLPLSLLALRKALEKSGRTLDVIQPGPQEELTAAVERAMTDSQAFFLARTPAVLKRKVLLGVLKSAHNHKVAILAFSSAFVKAGALVALEVSPEAVGLRAAARVLGRTPSPLEPELSVNEKRAEYLGLPLTAGLRVP